MLAQGELSDECFACEGRVHFLPFGIEVVQTADGSVGGCGGDNDVDGSDF